MGSKPVSINNILNRHSLVLMNIKWQDAHVTHSKCLLKVNEEEKS